MTQIRVLFAALMIITAFGAQAKELTYQEPSFKIAGDAPAAEILGSKRQVKNPQIPLKGSLRDYIYAVVHTNGAGEVTEFKWVPCHKSKAAKCVEIVGESCPGKLKTSESCEGMSLSVRVIVEGSKAIFDSANGSGGEVKNQLEIESQLKSAP